MKCERCGKCLETPLDYFTIKVIETGNFHKLCEECFHEFLRWLKEGRK